MIRQTVAMLHHCCSRGQGTSQYSQEITQSGQANYPTSPAHCTYCYSITVFITVDNLKKNLF